MSIQTVEAATYELAQAAATYRSGVQAVAADPGLSNQGRLDARAELKCELSAVVERLTHEATPLLRTIEAQNEDRLRDLSRGDEATAAVSRVSMALEQSHPGDLVNILVDDGDVAGLLALRQVAPSIAGRFAKAADERAGLADTIRRNIDKALAASTSTTPTSTAAIERFAIDDARERYLAAVNYAINPDHLGQLGYALSDALVSA